MCMLSCLKIGPKVGKVHNRDNEGNVANLMTMATVKILLKIVGFSSYLKTTCTVKKKFGYILENSILNSSTVSKKCILSSF